MRDVKYTYNTFLNRVNLLVVSAILGCTHQVVPGFRENTSKINEVSDSFIKKEISTYVIRDSNLLLRPAWLNSPLNWALENEGEKAADFEYIFYETAPMFNRNFACELSKVNMRQGLSYKIALEFENELLSVIQKIKDIPDKTEDLKNYFNTQLPVKIAGFIKGALVLSVYWEYREYKTELGSNANFKAYTCASLIKIHKKNISKAVESTREYLLKSKEIIQTSSVDNFEIRTAIDNATVQILKRYAYSEN